jgi:O-antigen ligase
MNSSSSDDNLRDSQPSGLLDARYLDGAKLSPMILLGFVLAIGAGFFLVDHSFNASTYFRKVHALELEANRTADRIEAVNLASTPMRLMLGVLGVWCLFNAPRSNLRWGGMILFSFSMYCAYIAASSTWSINAAVTLQKCVVFFMMSVAGFGLARWISLQDLAKIFALVCLCYILGGLAIEILLGNFRPHLPDYRFVGTAHPNSLAAYGTVCCLAAPVFTKRGQSVSYLTIAMVFIGIAVLLATKSRTTLAGMVFAVLATRFITFKPNNRIFGVAFMLLLFVGFGGFLSVSRNSTLNALGDVMAMGRTDDVGSLTGRLPLWEELGTSIEKRPIFGHGYLAYWQKDQIERLFDILGWEIPHGHNMYLDLLIDGGVIGLSLFLFYLIVSLTVSFRRYLKYRDIGAAFVFGMLIFALIHGSAESLFKLPTFLLFIIVTTTLRLGMLPNEPLLTEEQPWQQ